VLILKHAPRPYSDLYKEYSFDEPWDGPNNARLANRIGAFYLRKGLDPDGTDSTSFVAVVGPETAWPGAETRAKNDVTDGAAKTLLVIEMADAGIPWMKPEDLHFDRMSFRVNDGSGRGPGSKISGSRALLASGQVRELSDDSPPAVIRAMMTIRGGESVQADSLGGKVIDETPALSR
jgi:hypothetical protein